jgi:hypothetical protein
VSFEFNNDFDDFITEPLVYHVDARALLTAEVSWYRIMVWLGAHPEVSMLENYHAFRTTLEFPSKDLFLEFLLTFPGLLKGEE